MADINIGYTPSQVKQLMEDVAKSFVDLGSTIGQGYSVVPTTLQANWVGVDEQDYEEKLAKTVCELYRSSYSLVDALEKTIKGLAEGWQEYQNANRLSGGESTVANTTYSFELPNYEPFEIETVVKLSPVTFTEDTKYGVVSGGDATIVKTLDTFAGAVKDGVEQVFNGISVTNAFFGTQTTDIEGVVVAAKEALKKFVSNIDEMKEHVSKLAGSSYTTANTEAGNAAKAAADTIGGAVTGGSN